MVTRDQEQIRYRHDMATRVQEEIRYNPHLVTGTQGDIPYCSLGTSSGKQKKAHSTSQPPFCRESTPKTKESDQILLVLQQLASNSNSANNNNNNNNKISKLSKFLSKTMPGFDGKSDKIELFEDLFQTSVKNHNQLREEDEVNYFHSLMRRDALKTLKTSAARTERIWQKS